MHPRRRAATSIDSAMSQPSSRSVVITGAGSGIGAETACEFARRGYRLAVSDLNERASEATAERLRELGAEAIALRCDVSRADDVQALFDAAAAAFGRVDVAFNNAGVGGGGKSLIDATEADFDACIGTNLKGTWLCMKAAITQMLAQGGGAIVNNCSIMGLNGAAGAAYCASKHGVAGLTRSAALVYGGRGVRVNAVCPGLIDAGLGKALINRLGSDTARLYQMIPAGRAGTTLEVAKAVAWLASDEASFVHGLMLTVDGGYDVH